MRIKNLKPESEAIDDPGLSKSDRIREIIKNHMGTITKADLLEMNPDISDTTIQRALAELLKNGEIEKSAVDVTQNMCGKWRFKWLQVN